jgi:hypothetical protein
VRYDEIANTILGSSADDWALVSVEGSAYLDRFEELVSAEQSHLEIESHVYLAVYRPDVDLRLGWGMRQDTGLTFPDWDFPDGSISRLVVDAFWRGALVGRWSVLSVDGGRCYMPDPSLAVAAVGSAPRDLEVIGSTVGESRVALARLLQQIQGREDAELDSYLHRANVVVVPDAGLD